MNETIETLSSLYPEFMALYMYVDPNTTVKVNEEEEVSLRSLYDKSVEKHNKQIMDQPDQYNSGFDLFVPEVQHTNYGSFGSRNMKKIDFNVVCAAKLYRTHVSANSSTNLISSVNTGYYMYPRSSISKTELRLANNVGIIDSGYRGNLMGMFDCVHTQSNAWEALPKVAPGNRITQICAPGLQPIYVILVNDLAELGVTSRGTGGFGSTGR
jgi:dUTP pyrophosphatase